MGDGSSLDASVERFATEVGAVDPVTIAGTSSRGGAVPGVRCVTAPTEIAWVEPAEMTMRCGAGATVADVEAALAEHGQCLTLPTSGSVGGALAVGESSVRRLGWGPMRDAVLQIRYVSAAGEIVKAGGPTVKNVTGFDLCRLLVGSRGTLGFIADVILRTRPVPTHEQWFSSERDPWALLGELYRPTSVLWDGRTTWVLLAGHADDVDRRAQVSDLTPVAGPPPLPSHRRSSPPAALRDLAADLTSRPGVEFVAEVGVGVVHQSIPVEVPASSPEVVELHRRLKHEFDPAGRLNPGVDVLSPRR